MSYLIRALLQSYWLVDTTVVHKSAPKKTKTPTDSEVDAKRLKTVRDDVPTDASLTADRCASLNRFSLSAFRASDPLLPSDLEFRPRAPNRLRGKPIRAILCEPIAQELRW